MIDISKIETYGWESAIRGMRNSYGSWDKTDSYYEELTQITPDGTGVYKTGEIRFRFGSNDLELASRLAKLGGSHAKFRRMIGVSCDILAPFYWWKEFDTYKVGTVSNSTSTMHSIMKKEFEVTDFLINGYTSPEAGTCLISIVGTLNQLREKYLQEENYQWKKMYWQDVISLLPSSYGQLRTISMNYEVLSHMIQERLGHKLNEWQEFIRKMMVNLPYSRELICDIQVDSDEEKA